MSIFTPQIEVNDSAGNPISSTGTSLNVDVTNFPATQPVSGTVTAKIEDTAGNALASTGTSLNVNVTNTVPVSGTVTVTQATGTNLHTVVDNFPADADALAQGSTTAGQLGALSMGAVTTAPPTYTSGQTDPLSLTPAGALRVDGSAVTQPVSFSGTITTTSNKASTATTTRVATSAVAVTLLAANANRKKLIITTETGANNYVAFGSTASATNYSYDLVQTATLEDIVWTGSVSLIRATGTGNVQVTELV